MVSEMWLSRTKPLTTTLETNLKLTSTEYDTFINEESIEEKDKLLTDPSQYQRLVGRLLCLTMTRIDIAYVVQVLSQFMHKPKTSHIEVALRVVKYIKGAPRLGPVNASRQFQQTWSLLWFRLGWMFTNQEINYRLPGQVWECSGVMEI